MRLAGIALVLWASAWCCAADAAHLRAVKARLTGRLASKHHKRGVLSAVPPFKLGHDIPRVTHSVLKPLVVTYPPTAAVTAVKLPLAHPLLPRYPVGVGHRVPHLPHPHYGLKFPHHSKAVVLPKPDHHFHHHHHHVSPRPVVSVLPAAPVPVAAPAIAQPLPVPSPPVIVPSPLPPPAHIHSAPNHLHLKPLVPAAPGLLPAPAPVVAPAFSSFAPQFPYILRAGGAIQSSLFATYPRYPFSNYPSPLIPLGASAYSQVVPHYVGPQPAVPAVQAYGELPQPGVHLQPAHPNTYFQSAQPALHLHPAQSDVHLHPASDVHVHSAQPEVHLQPGVHAHGQPDIHFQQPEFNLQPAQPGYHLQPGHTDVHLQTGHPELHFQGGHTDVHIQPQPDYHYEHGQPDVHLQPQPDYHLQQGQPEVHPQPQPDFHYQPGELDVHVQSQPDYHVQPAQPDYSLQGGAVHPTQPTVDSAGWSPVPSHSTETGHGDVHYPPDGHHHYSQEQVPGTQVVDHHSGTEQQYLDYANQLHHHIQHQLGQAQYDHQFNQQQQPGPEYGAPQGQGNHQDFGFQQPAAEYGAPGSGAEGRSGEGEGEGDTQQYHNHIPLGLQPPIDRPLEHFR